MRILIIIHADRPAGYGGKPISTGDIKSEFLGGRRSCVSSARGPPKSFGEFLGGRKVSLP